MSRSKVYLIPAPLDENGIGVIPAYLTDVIKNCQVFFVENERTARRYLKKLWKTYLPGEEIIIDNYQWYIITEHEIPKADFRQKIKEEKTIGIISEAGCPGVADPGQQLVAIAHEMNAEVRPLTGPSSVLLALMASGMNGQNFHFNGYLPIKQPDRNKTIKELENESVKKQCTQIFIETPYRNNQLLDNLLSVCNPKTRLCIAANLTGEKEWIKTKTMKDWASQKPDLHKLPVIFLLQTG
jgi:16S rRNA (cytidine1402-2'-O)-methyltransferase